MSESAVIQLTPTEVNFMDGIYRKYAVDVYKYLRVYIKRIADDEIYDCVQETFLIAMKKIKDFICVRNVGGWIFKTAILNANNFIRKRRYELSRIVYKELDENDIADNISAECAAIENVEPSEVEFHEKVNSFFATLTEEERIIYNCLINKKDKKNIALQLNVNLNRAYYMCKKFEDRMRQYLLN